MHVCVFVRVFALINEAGIIIELLEAGGRTGGRANSYVYLWGRAQLIQLLLLRYPVTCAVDISVQFFFCASLDASWS